MHQQTRKLLTIITESALESALCEELIQLGAGGYTVTDARGRGSRGVRDAGWSSSGTIRIEVVCDTGVAVKMAGRLRDKYYSDYAMILFLSDVSVLRPQKF